MGDAVLTGLEDCALVTDVGSAGIRVPAAAPDVGEVTTPALTPVGELAEAVIDGRPV